VPSDVRDPFLRMAESTLPTLTIEVLAKLYRNQAALAESHDREHKDHVLVVSALLELLGGQALIPQHALANAPGFQTARTSDGALVLQTVDTGHH
jgi:hypothetical protein